MRGGSEKRPRGGVGGGDVQDDPVIDPARGPYGEPLSGDDDTVERKRREERTVTAEKRHLRNRTREGGSKGGIHQNFIKLGRSELHKAKLHKGKNFIKPDHFKEIFHNRKQSAANGEGEQPSY